ncbi:MAG: hypothetical protein LBT08_00565, partial [Synergistaceae bacterium]|nr:hypothetical protein [Synergistaceae bacterium]
KKKGDNFIRCGGDIVAWASGHLLELFEPEDYDERYKRWGHDTFLYVPEKWERKEISRTKGLFSGLRKLINALNDSDVIVNVGDADREGTLLIDEILDYCGWAGTTKRLRINDMNPNVIRKAIENIRDNADFRGEYMAGQARLYSDWLVGLALTRFLTVSIREAGYEAGIISVGRVQTPTLGLVVKRDKEIRDFIAAPYCELYATLVLDGDEAKEITGRWQLGEVYSSLLDEQKRITDREAVCKLAESLEDRSGEITSVSKKAHRVPPPLAYSLSRLQMAASRKYDITDTLLHLQKLYEAGYVTYPRSGCEYIPEGHFMEAGKIIDAIRAGCSSLADMLAGADLSRKSPAWNSEKISEHHAIIPTARVPLAGAISETERKIYELVCSRYVLQFLACYEYEEMSVEFTAGGEVFRATGRTVTNLGWQGWDKQDKRDDESEESDSKILPAVRQGDSGKIHPFVADKMTNPPKHYTYHSLLAAMNSIHLHVNDPQIRAKLKEIAGTGTEATQESILAVLFKRGYLKKEKKQVISTDLGQALIEILSGGEGEGEIKSSVMVYPDMTALWEQRMTAIEFGNLSLDSFLGDVADMVRGIISAPLNIPSEIPDFKRLKKCLTEGCEGFLRHIELKGKSPFFSCPVCHKTFNDVGGSPVPKSEKTGEIITARCPLGCGGSARRFEGKYGIFWKCDCSPDTTFKDVSGAPAVREAKIEAKCPVTGCKGTAMRLLSKKTDSPFWLCHVCGNFFDDLGGVPVPRKVREVAGV